MKTLLKVSSAAALAFAALATTAQAQTVEMKGLGSSALFLEAGLAASAATGSGGLGATCVWSTSVSNAVVATDTSTGTSIADSGNAWVAWTPSGSSCTTIDASTHIWSYLQTDSVVGNRCLFNGSACTIAYPTSNPAASNLILASGEINLPIDVANALNSASVNAAGTDIRPEDAKFAMNRALTACGTPLPVNATTNSQYLGLGYTNGSVINHAVGTGSFNVIDFTLPASFNVTPVGATPVLVVVHSDGTSTGFGDPSITNISSTTLAKFLDGSYSYTAQVLSPSTTSGPGATVLIREPLSGTYNTMEFNAPNTTVNQTSQDVGLTQPIGQVYCYNPTTNPALNVTTASGGARQRAIGTGQELAQVRTINNSLGYGFWSVANFSGFTSSTTQKYLTVDGVEPLLKSTVTHTGVIPTTGTTAMRNVDLHTTADGSYPIWSMIRLVGLGTTAPAGVSSLATAAQNFVSFNSTTARPDFITPSALTVVRSHFTPPTVATTPNNGDCTAPEAGGDVGGQVLTISSDVAFCPTGQTEMRR